LALPAPPALPALLAPIAPLALLALLAVLALLALSTGLALGAARGDSITVDEPIHLLAGYASLVEGDHRLSPEHPPLARMWAALPLVFSHPRWPPPEAAGWHQADYFDLARDWLSRCNDGGRLIWPARVMMVALLAALCLATAAAARRLLGGAAAGLALFVAALDPTLLAHGHYVTTDLPAALTALLVVLTCSRLFADPSPGRFALAALALGAASLVKFSWLLLLPALAMAAIAAVASPRLAPGLPQRPAARAGVVAALGVALLTVVALAIWLAYGFSYFPSRAAGPEVEHLPSVSGVLAAGNPGGSGAAGSPGLSLPATPAERWQTVLTDPTDGTRLAGLPRLVAFARDHRLLPEPYLYGMAYAYRKGLHRSAFLMGHYSTAGWPSYFPIAFAIKTPLPTLLLLAAGIAALLARGVRSARAARAVAPLPGGGERGAPPAAMPGVARTPGDGLLAISLATFVAVYAGAAIASHLDIGQRHLLPLYPAVFVGAGAAAAWLPGRGRLAVLALCLWLLAGTLLAYPSYLSYFNEVIGGARNGHFYLSDSNVDWGQDLLRLAAYSRRHPDEPILLAQFGGVPLPRGFSPGILLEGAPDTPLNPLGAGTYAVSATELTGVYEPLIRDESWRRPEVRQLYLQLAQAAARGRLAPGSAAAEGFDFLRRVRLLNGLRYRPADGRIGGSLFLFRLGAADLAALTRP
jgi:hypothetical protein